MQRIINGKLKDTGKMTELWSEILCGEYHTDFNYHEITLYESGEGVFYEAHNYFAKDGDALSMLGDKQDALAFCEEHNVDMDNELLIKTLFQEMSE